MSDGNSNVAVLFVAFIRRNVMPSVSFRLGEVVWLKNKPSERDCSQIRDLFRNALEKTILEETEYGRFDEHLGPALLSSGCSDVSDNDITRVSYDSGHTLDLTATMPDRLHLAIEIEKTEIKRVIHDMLKIAAYQRGHDAVGLIVVPTRCTTTNGHYARTHLQECRDVLELLECSHPWQGDSLGVITYENVSTHSSAVATSTAGARHE